MTTGVFLPDRAAATSPRKEQVTPIGDLFASSYSPPAAIEPKLLSISGCWARGSWIRHATLVPNVKLLKTSLTALAVSGRCISNREKTKCR